MAQGLGLPTSNLGWATNGVPMADFFSSDNGPSDNSPSNNGPK